MREYLTTLGSRAKWHEQQENVKKGDVVLIIDPDVARRNWKLGTIENVYPGKDDLVRGDWGGQDGDENVQRTFCMFLEKL